MVRPRSASEIWGKDFLEMRARVLDVAAALDRLERAADSDRLFVSTTGGGPSPYSRLRDAMEILIDGQPNRAERVQLTFSLPYHPGWREA